MIHDQLRLAVSQHSYTSHTVQGSSPCCLRTKFNVQNFILAKHKVVYKDKNKELQTFTKKKKKSVHVTPTKIKRILTCHNKGKRKRKKSI